MHAACAGADLVVLETFIRHNEMAAAELAMAKDSAQQTAGSARLPQVRPCYAIATGTINRHTHALGRCLLSCIVLVQIVGYGASAYICCVRQGGSGTPV